MRTTVLGSMVWFIFYGSLSVAHAQDSAPNAPGVPAQVPTAGIPAAADAAPMDIGPPLAGLTNPASPDWPQLWFDTDYLLWWVKSAPVPVPLVTSGSAGDAMPGAIGQPGTSVLYGAQNQNFPGNSGARINFGGWLTNAQTVGVEISGFFLEQQTAGFVAGSNAAGVPVLGAPFFDAQLGKENALLVSIPGAFSGSIGVNNSTTLWGAEANGLYNLYRSPTLQVNLLGGFRTLNLSEELDINGIAKTLPGVPVFTVNTMDSFATQNQFYGGQLGGQATMRRGRFSLNLAGKLALGGVYQTINTSGAVILATPPTLTGGLGGIYAQPSNIGLQSQTTFALIPELQLKLAYAITPWLQASVGYNFLYVSSVVRPGDQIDRTINTSQLNPGGALVGPARPAPLFNTTDFYAQGLSVGMTLRY